jgi:hypothetical protein
MKKDNGSHRPTMRKKTQADIRADRIARSRVIANNTPKDLCWDDLHRLNLECRGAFSVVDPVVAIIRNADLVTRLGENATRLRGMANTLLRDVKIYQLSLDDIAAKHHGRTGGDLDGTLLFESLVIGEEYQQWLASFNTVVVAGVHDVLDLVDTVINPDDVVVTTIEPTPSLT